MRVLDQLVALLGCVTMGKYTTALPYFLHYKRGENEIIPPYKD